MITRFEKRVVAWLLTALLCWSLLFSSGMTAYAEEKNPEEAMQEVNAGNGDDTPAPKDEETASKPADPDILPDSEQSSEKKEATETQTAAQTTAKAAENFGDYEYQILDNGAVEITKYNGSESELSIPDTIGGKNVGSIGKEAFAKNDTITQVRLPSTVTTIQYMAFAECFNLKNVVLPSGSQLKKIDKFAFRSCGITKMDLSSVQEIGEYAFQSCTQLESVTLGNQLTSLGRGTFSYSGIQTINIPNTLSAIEDSLFIGCWVLKEISLPDSIVRIGDYAFDYSGLEKMDLPKSVTNIGNYAFAGTGLKEIILPESITSLGDGAFANTGLKEIVLPESVTSLGDSAFAGCKNLSSVQIGNQLAYIPDSAFSGCNLTAIVVNGNMKRIGRFAYTENTGLSEVTIPQNITNVEYAAFRNCTALSKIDIPETLEKVGGFAFDGTEWYKNQPEGIVYAGNVLYGYKGTMPDNTVIEAKAGTLGIAGYAFYGDTTLTEIQIPDTITNIGEFAFHDCTSMTSVVIPANVTEIGEKALGYKTKAGAELGINTRKAGDNSEKMEDFTIYGRAGSAAQTYANDNSFTFVAQAVDDPTPPTLRIVPEVTDSIYVIGSGGTVTITCTGELKDFVSVYMDGSEVDRSNYSLREGSTILTFTTKYLDTLSVGKHTVTLNYTYASVDTELTVLARGSNSGSGTAGTTGTTGSGTANSSNGSRNSTSPRTGDPASIMLWILAAIFATGIGAVILKRRRMA